MGRQQLRSIAVALVVLAGACSSDDVTQSADTTSTSETTTETTVPLETIAPTPAPSAEVGGQIEADVAGIYAGVPEGKAVDWAVATCRYLLEGNDRPRIEDYIVQRFAGGDRPDPTPDQASAIYDVIVGAGFCE